MTLRIALSAMAFFLLGCPTSQSHASQKISQYETAATVEIEVLEGTVATNTSTAHYLLGQRACEIKLKYVFVAPAILVEKGSDPKIVYAWGACNERSLEDLKLILNNLYRCKVGALLTVRQNSDNTIAAVTTLPSLGESGWMMVQKILKGHCTRLPPS